MPIWSTSAGEKHLGVPAFTWGGERSTMVGMERLPDDSSGGRSKARTALRHIERAVASVLLVIGAAALIGWIVVEIYVKAVTQD